MSLLLDALKRAEDNSGRRRRAAAASEAPGGLAPADPGRGFPELTLSEVEPPARNDGPADSQVAPGEEPALTVAPAPRAAQAGAPVGETGGQAPAEPRHEGPSAPGPAANPQAPRTRTADARSAARVLRAQAAPAAAQRRRPTQMLAGIAVALLAAFSALWWWADSQAPAPARPRTLETAPVAAAPLEAPTAVTTTSAPASATALPAPGSEPVAPPSRRSVPASAPAIAPAAPPASIPTAAPTPRPPRAHAATAARSGPTPAMPAPAAQGAAPPRPGLRVAPYQDQLQQAYADFQAGRLDAAGRSWREIVAADPLQADAWLGLGVLAHRAGRREEAILAYRRVLRIDADNGPARAGLARLEGAAGDPLEESRLREAIARAPADAMLNSALARLLSEQGRWDEAQPFWFAAHSAAPQEPAHAFNLAVSLDRLHKADLALRYYRMALALAAPGPASFDLAAARARVQALEQRKANSPAS